MPTSLLTQMLKESEFVMPKLLIGIPIENESDKAFTLFSSKDFINIPVLFIE